jgi:hypothetical protein
VKRAQERVVVDDGGVLGHLQRDPRWAQR